jgi:hypothetical protein
VGPEQTEAEYAAERRMVHFPCFLHNRVWHENERLGWFGGTARTECEIAHNSPVEGKCIAEHKESGAKVICWNDSKWEEKFWPRFLEHLPAETTLVCVDYHV